MKRTTRTLSAVIAALMLLLCFASCNSGTSSQKINVEVWVYKDAACNEPFVAANDISLPVGSTVIDAVDALCEKRSSTYTMGTDNQFMTFTYESETLEGSETTLDDGNVDMKYLGWKLNGVAMLDSNATTLTLPKDQVLNDGDVVIVYMMEEIVKPAAG